MMNKHTRRAVLAALLLVITLFLLLTVSVSAVDGFTPQGNPKIEGNYWVYQVGLTGNYSASINKHIEYHGDDALLYLKVWRADENVNEWSYSICLTGWKCTVYSSECDEFLIPLKDIETSFDWGTSVLDTPWVFMAGDNVSNYILRVYVPRSYDISGAESPFIDTLMNVPTALKNGFNGFFFYPNGTITKTARYSMGAVVFAIALSIFVTIFKHLINNLNVFGRKK